MSKQETLEKAAKKYRLSTVNKMGIEEVAFITGAKSEAARDYWFEQFKNKGGDK
jgi:hypothetical protein